MVAYPGYGLLASTEPDGYALADSTATILSWTAPDDGAWHQVAFAGELYVTAAETGGEVTFSYTTPGGTAATGALIPASQGTGTHTPGLSALTVAAGSTVTVSQGSALTAGAAVLFLQLRGA